jgi:putative effector of murein hydrolase LrgA (UPF0299 family)
MMGIKMNPRDTFSAFARKSKRTSSLELPSLHLKINMKKVLLAGVAATVVSTILGFLTCGWLFNWVYQLEPTSIWKPMEENFGAWMATMTAGALILNIILAKVYAVIYKSIPRQGIKRGLMFGFLVWSVSILPGMFSMYMTMTVATTVVIYWLLQGLVNLLILGAVIAAIYKEE